MLCATIVLGGCASESTAPRSGVERPEDVVFITEDLPRFWAAYDAGGREGSEAAFQARYLDSASAGLREMASKRSITAASLASLMLRAPRYFAALRAEAPMLHAGHPLLSQLRANFRRVEQLFPDATYPPVTFLIGRFTNGGTIGERGLLIALEFHGADVRAPADELSAFGRANQLSLSVDLPAMVAHEHAHTMQVAMQTTAANEGSSLLARSLSEGVAEFVADLTAGRPLFRTRYAVWQSREAEFWSAFRAERTSPDVSRWLFNQVRATPEWPGDLGYFIGYRIAQAYFARATNAEAALRTLLATRDAEAILRESGYDGSGPPIPLTP